MARYTAKILCSRTVSTDDFDANGDAEALAHATRLAGDINNVLSMTTADVMGHHPVRVIYERH